jgi:hypothetical protein
MLTAFGHLEGLGLAETSRNCHDDEYSDDEATATTFPTPARIVWNSESKSKSNTVESLTVDELILCTEHAGSCFVSCNFASFQEIGTLSTEDGLSLSLRAPAAFNPEQSTFKTLVVTGKFTGKGRCTIPAGDEWRWVESLFASVTASHVLVLDTVLATKIPLVSAAEGRPSAPLLYHLGTSSFVISGKELSEGRALDTSLSPLLPNAVLMEGISGAFMSHCESSGVSAVALLSLVERAVVDSTTLFAYESAFELNHDIQGRRLMYKEAAKGSSKQLDSMYL